jgi:hypothetical protein
VVLVEEDVALMALRVALVLITNTFLLSPSHGFPSSEETGKKREVAISSMSSRYAAPFS